MSQIEPDILKTTEQWLVVTKPSGWLSVPGRGEHPCLSEWLSDRFGRVWPVHRLDLGTSGVILFARNADAHRLANGWFSRHEVKKTYEFIAQGRPRLPTFRIQARVDGSAAITQIEAKESYVEGYYGHARPVTGRTHQIRKHLAREGTPIWGDPEYGGPEQITIGGRALSIGRVALHARRLELPGGEVFVAELPEDFRDWLGELRKGGQRV